MRRSVPDAPRARSAGAPGVETGVDRASGLVRAVERGVDVDGSDGAVAALDLDDSTDRSVASVATAVVALSRDRWDSV